MIYEVKEKKRPTKEERETKKDKSRREAEKALIERKQAEDAFRANFDRLKAERRSREKS